MEEEEQEHQLVADEGRYAAKRQRTASQPSKTRAVKRPAPQPPRTGKVAKGSGRATAAVPEPPPPQPDPPAAPPGAAPVTWAQGDACWVEPDGPATVFDGVVYGEILYVKYAGFPQKFKAKLSQLHPPAALQQPGDTRRTRRSR